MPPSKEDYLFRKLVKNAKWCSKSSSPFPVCKILPFKKGSKKREKNDKISDFLQIPQLCLVVPITGQYITKSGTHVPFEC